MKQFKKAREERARAKRATSHRSPSRLRRQERRRKLREDADLDRRASKSGIKIARTMPGIEGVRTLLEPPGK